MAQKRGPRLRGQRLLDNAPCQAAVSLDSGALPFPRHRALLVQHRPDRHAKGSPSGRAGERSETERASPGQKSFCAAISRFFVRAILSLCFYISVSILALSVIASQCHCPGCGSQRLLRCRSHPAGRGPNSSSLFPPLAAVVAVAPKGRGFGRPEGAKDPLSEMAAPRGAGYLAKFQNIIDSSSQIELCHVGKLKACWQSR